jgi:hypothetical protein
MFSDLEGHCYLVILYGHMHDIHKKVTIIVVSRKAIFTLCIYIVTYTTTKEVFSELYFEEHEKLPKIITVSEEEQFAFTVAPPELNITSYEYVISLGDEILDEGDFILHPGENTTVNVSCISENLSLVLVDHAEHNRSLRIPQKISCISPCRIFKMCNYNQSNVNNAFKFQSS